MAKKTINTPFSSKSVDVHIHSLITGQRKFENIYQSLTRMMLDDSSKIKKVNVN